MMPDLGKYEFAVLSSYAVSLGLIGVLVVVSIVRARAVRRTLEEVEKRVKRHG